MSGNHAGGGEVNRLLAGSALPVDRHAGHGLRPPGGQQGSAADVHRLLAGLHDATPDHVVDEAGINAGLLDQSVEHLRGQVGGVDAGQASVALSDGRTNRLDDDCFSHGYLL